MRTKSIAQVKVDCAKKPSIAQLKSAAEKADWEQIAMIHVYGPPCFHFESNRRRFCLRSKSWHVKDATHNYVSLADLLGSLS